MTAVFVTQSTLWMKFRQQPMLSARFSKVLTPWPGHAPLRPPSHSYLVMQGCIIQVPDRRQPEITNLENKSREVGSYRTQHAEDDEVDVHHVGMRDLKAGRRRRLGPGTTLGAAAAAAAVGRRAALAWTSFSAVKKMLELLRSRCSTCLFCIWCSASSSSTSHRRSCCSSTCLPCQGQMR